MYFICPACNTDHYTAGNLNKHLSTCKVYIDFIKTYIPPKTISCEKCNLQFIKEENLKEHISRCK